MTPDTPAPQETSVSAEWLSIAAYLSQHFDRSYDTRLLSDQVARVIEEQGALTLIANAFGTSFAKDTVFLEFDELRATKANYPLLCWYDDGTPFVIVGRTLRGSFRVLEASTDGGLIEIVVKKSVLKREYQGGIFFEDVPLLDVWDKDPSFNNKKRWFWGSIKPLFASMRYLILAAFVGNILAVSVSLFALQVWDRVIPAQSINSLTVLVMGAVVAVIFEMTLRLQRAAMIDDVGKDVDMRISSGVYAHMLDMKSDARPQSLGSMAAQIREINQIREAISSSMVSAAIDLPFVFVYIAVIYMIGGTLVYPILAVIPVVIIIGLIAQFPLSRLASEGLEEASLRNGLIVESVLKSDEIKLLEAEPTMRLRWERTVETANVISNKQRRWRNFLTNSTQSLQQLTYISVVCMGAMSVIAGDVTMGQVIACSILANRSIAPLTQISVVMGALQGSVVAKRSISELMARDADTPTAQHLRRDLSKPDYALKMVKYTYVGTDHVSLVIPNLEIKHGEKIGIIGRIGSGKSTLLRLLSGLAEPSDGTALLDNTEIAMIHPSDVRRAIGYQSQGASLMRGTIKDNLAIGRPSATDEEMLAACKVSGVMELIKNNPRGLDLMVNEAGEGLSGGQRQSLFLARTILRDPAIVLMDEPTASMDDQTEATFTKAMSEWATDKTVIIATHRLRPLAMCDRLIVVNDGRIAMDGPKDEILAKLNAKKAA